MPVAIITGASRGIGLATAFRFAEEGCDLVLAARTAGPLERAAEQVRERGVRVEALPTDLADPAAAAELVDIARGAFGRLDVLVNNAGAAPLAPIADMPTDSFEATLALNCGAVFHATQAAWPLLVETGGGVIVNVSSMASVDPFPGFAVYGACKAWVNLFTQAAAAEGRPAGIRVFAVAPGAVDTELLDGLFPDFPAEQRLAPREVAETILAVCQPSLTFSSGQTVFVRK